MTALADAPVATAASARHGWRVWRTPVIMAVIGAASLAFFWWDTPSNVESRFSLARPGDFASIPDFSVPAQTSAVVLSALALVLAVMAGMAAMKRRNLGWWLPVTFGVAVMGSLLVWAGADRVGTRVLLTVLLINTVVMAIPLVFGSLAAVVCERSGVINIAIEGQLLFGAFLAALVASATGNAYMGLIAAPLAGALVGAALALFAVRYWVDQIVVGVVLNVLVIGLTSYLFSTVMRDNPGLNRSMGLQTLPIPGLSSIPVIGPVLFNHNLLVYIMFAVVIALHIMLFKSRWGLRVRAVGEHPKAADTVGIKVNRTRVRNVILGGAIAGLGGASFTVAASLAFGKEMTAGKGFIALAAMILGRWSPKGALAAALLFGFSAALGDQLGIMGSAIPSQFLAMLPYLATLFAVAGLVGHARPPAAAGKPYKK